MTTPAWVPPQVPELTVPEPEHARPYRVRRYRALAAVGVAAVVAFAGGMVLYSFLTTSSSEEAGTAVVVVDELIDDMVNARWQDAFEAFDQSCIDFSTESFELGFAPFLRNYKDHDLTEPRRTEFSVDEIVLVRGEFDLGESDVNPLRAELLYAGPDAPAEWRLCGLRIDEP